MEQVNNNEQEQVLRQKEQDILEQYRSETKKRAESLSMRGIEKALGERAFVFSNHTSEASGEGHSEDSEDSVAPASEALPGSALGLFLSSDELEGGSQQETAPEPEDRSVAMEKMRELIRDNFFDAARTYKEASDREAVDELLLRMAIEASGGSKVSSRNPVTDALRSRIEADRLARKQVEDSSPEGYTVYHGLELREYARAVREGEIAETPYVAKNLRRVERNMSSGRPTFLHGHLGGGKTELAITAAKHTAISNAAYREAVKACKENPSSDREEMQKQLRRTYQRLVKEYSKALRDGDDEATDRFAPLIISGSKDLTTQDMYTDKTLVLTKFNGKSLLEHKKELDGLIDKWQLENAEELKGLSPEERRKKESDAATHILEMYKMQNQAFGTEVKQVIQPIRRAVEQGRPVIIDEVNAIPAAILISLNDILQRKPGETCYIPGEGEVAIKEGFSITMTGNLDTQSVVYGGTEDLNPAFLSRLDVIEYDYLPMSESDSGYDRQEDPKKNELFQVAMSYLVDRQGNLQLPEMEESLAKIFALCQLAHQSQIIFEGKWRESNFNLRSDSGDEVEPRLEKSVLSVRNLLNILKEWDKGSEKSLDAALLDGFISGMVSPEERSLMIGLAVQHGFFQSSEGWKVETKEGAGAGAVSHFEVSSEGVEFHRMPLETLSMMDTVDAIFGRRPERELYPELTLEELEMEVDDDMLIDRQIEIVDNAEKKIDELKLVIGAMEVLYNQCGCNAEAA